MTGAHGFGLSTLAKALKKDDDGDASVMQGRPHLAVGGGRAW
jgi:hypothetical protein